MQVDTQDRFYNEILDIKLKQKLIKNIKLVIIRPQVNEMLL
jgi:hypothetical protein